MLRDQQGQNSSGLLLVVRLELYIPVSARTLSLVFLTNNVLIYFFYIELMIIIKW